jgi:2,4-dienoyl-CoA reductase-like NADH-dependent reductase (Old Yellow Enzyme family)
MTGMNAVQPPCPECDLALDTPFTLANGTVIKNRIWKSAMSEQLADGRHNPGPGLANLYARWAQGGVGLSVSGNIMIDRNAIGQLGNVVLDERSDLAAFKAWTAAGTRNDTQFWAQLNHPGKQIVNLLSRQPVAPSAIGLSEGLERSFNKPRALTEAEIVEIIRKFGLSARLAVEAGFTGVQIHGAHGYLVSQFLSPRHNRRTDQWGGSLDQRMRFVVEVYRAIRLEVGDRVPVGIKLNSADFMHDGFAEGESMTVVETLSALGIDQIEISGGTYENPVMVSGLTASAARREAYFLEYADEVRRRIMTPLVVTGGFRSSAGMLAALRSRSTDFVGIARPLAVDPDLPRKAIRDDAFRIELRRLTTGFAVLDQVAALNVSWYEHQLRRMARNKAPDPNSMILTSVARTLIGYGVCAFKGSRIRRAEN